jgi:hypothetical protein
MNGEGLAEGFDEGGSELRWREDLDLGHPAEEEAFESAAFGDGHVDDEAIELPVGAGRSFDFTLRGMEGALGEDARDDAVELQADLDRLPVKPIETVLGEELFEVEIGRSLKRPTGLPKREDVIDGEGGDHLATMVKADDFEGRAIGIEVDSIGFKESFAALTVVEGLVAHQELALVEGSVGQLVDQGAVARVVLGRHRSTTKDGRESLQFGLEGTGQGGTNLLEKGTAMVAKGGAERGEADTGDRLLGEDEGCQLSGSQRRGREGGMTEILVEHLPASLLCRDRVVAHQLIEIAPNGDVIDLEMAGEFGLRVGSLDQEKKDLDDALGEGATIGVERCGREGSALLGHGRTSVHEWGSDLAERSSPGERSGSVPKFAVRRGSRWIGRQWISWQPSLAPPMASGEPQGVRGGREMAAEGVRGVVSRHGLGCQWQRKRCTWGDGAAPPE